MFVGIPLCAIVVESLWKQSNKRLKEKNLATEISAYYPTDALIEADTEKPHNITSIVVNFLVSLFCKIFKINKSKEKNKNNLDGTSNDTGDKK